MKKILTIFAMHFCLMVGTFTSATAQTYYYDFRNTLDEFGGQGPSLNVLGTGAFVNEGLTELSCISRPVYGFTQNSGVQFDNAAAGNFITGTYSVEMYFQFLDNSGFKRILDYKNQTSDFGLYITATLMQFYDVFTVNTTAFVANQYVHLVVTRDSTSKEVNMYVDGSLLGSFTDSTDLATLDGANVLNFFQDDLLFGGEARPGRIALLKIYSNAIDSATVASNFSSLLATSATLQFQADINTACLSGNIFNFTNTSLNAGGVSYTYDFGDGLTDVGPNATHSYAADGNYTVTLFADDGSGCTDSVSLDVLVYQQPPLDLGLDVSVCDGDSVVLDAGAGFTSYVWSDSSSNQTLTVSASGIYSVEILDGNGCAANDSIEITLVLPPVVNLVNDLTICFGDSISLIAPSGEASYLWSTGDTTETITVSVAGVYAVEVFNTTGCFATDTVEVFINPQVIVALGADTAICVGDTLILDASAGFVDYLWSDNSTSQTLAVTATGLFDVYVSDIFGCKGYDTISVVVNALPLVDLGQDTTFCGGTVFNLDGGPGFVNYLWSDGTQTQNINITSSGTYSLIVTDINGCSGTDEIIVNATPLVDLGPDLVQCDGNVVTLDAGAGIDFYFWSDGSGGQTIDVTTSGIYTVTVSDNNGCINTDEIGIVFNSLPVFDLGVDQFICDGSSTTLDAGDNFFAYLWNDGTTQQTLTVNTSGTYIVTVSSAPNCNVQDTVTVTVLPAPIINLGSDTTVCDGTIYTLDAGAGFTNYLWSDGTSNQTLNVTSSGSYSVLVTDTIGCFGVDTIMINYEAIPFVELGPDQTICDGTATVLDAGSGLSTYLWNDGTNSQFLLASTAGIYTVTVTNAAGCSSSDSTSIILLPPPPITLGADTTLCDGVVYTLDAGAGFNFYMWNDGSMMQTLAVTAAGLYTVTITDANGCVNMDDVDVSYFGPVTTPVITQNINVLQSSLAAGYQWYQVPGGLIVGATAQTFSPGQNGTFYVVITDSNGCQSAQSADYNFLLNGIPSITGVSLSISPNPANQSVIIETNGITSGSFTLNLVDMLGQTVHHQEMNANEKVRLDVSEYAEGIYFVRIIGNGFSTTQKLVINK